LKEGFRGRNEGAGTAKNRGYLLIRAWGCGFWSDVFHVLGQFLLAEITERRPVVYWGGNSLFSDNPTKNAFSDFFVDSSSKELDDVLRRDKSFWPQKWNVSNILGNDVNKFDGPFSRMAALYYLTRTEDVLVSDFYSGVVDLLPWIPASHSQFGKSVDEVYRYLFSKYLFPTNDIVNQVDAFVSEQLASRPFMAVHLRGSDKIEEVTDLNQRNVAYFEHIDAYLAKSDGGQIFLMTDDNHILVQMKTKYGNRILNTNSRRTSSAKGVHYQAADSRKLLGIEVMIDTYIAAKANCFVGNGGSNVSLAVSYIGSRDRQSCQLIGNNVLHGYGHLWSIQNW
jgi:protein O-GlcNAc transferase